MALSVPITKADDFITSAWEILYTVSTSSDEGADRESLKSSEDRRWLMSATRNDEVNQQRTFKRRALDAWTAFMDLVKVGSCSSDERLALR